MALFKSNEQKELEKQQKIEELMRKYGLEDLKDPKDVESVKKIALDLLGVGWMETGSFLQGEDIKTNVKVLLQYQKVIMEQNFMLIRILDKIANK